MHFKVLAIYQYIKDCDCIPIPDCFFFPLPNDRLFVNIVLLLQQDRYVHMFLRKITIYIAKPHTA